MRCTKCGEEVPNGNLFCTRCGTRVEQQQMTQQADRPAQQNWQADRPAQQNWQADRPAQQNWQADTASQQNWQADTMAQQNWQQTNQQMNVNQNSMGVPLKKKKSVLPKIIIAICIIAGLLAIGGVAAFFILNNKLTIELNKYVSVSYEGYNGIGEAYVEFDYDKFEDDYGEKIESKADAKKIEKEYDSKHIKYDDYAELLYRKLKFELDSFSALSNGDTITCSLKCDEEEILELFNCKLEYSDISVAIENLEDVVVFDAFEGVDIVLEGVAPYGSVYMSGKPTEECAQSFKYYFDKGIDLNNGDTVKLMIKDEDGTLKDECARTYGKVPETLEKTFTVSGLQKYVMTENDISAGALSEMQAKAVEAFNEDMEYWDSSEQILTAFDYLGTCFFTRKDDMSDYNNILFLVYKVQVYNAFNNGEYIYSNNESFYWCISFTDIILNEDGTYAEDTFDYYYVPRPDEGAYVVDTELMDGWYDNKTWEYEGFETLNDLYDEINYQYEDYYYNVVTNVVDIPDSSDDSSTVTPVGSEETEETGEEGIIFPNSSFELLKKKQIKKLSDKKLQRAINEIYARNGYIFKDESLGEYYSKYDWYYPTYTASEFSTSFFNDIENKNIKMLQKERDNRK